MKTVVNIFGGPGIGKSTTAAGVFSFLKLHGVDCELVTEFAKELTWEERHKTLRNQQYIFAKQYHRIWRSDVDIIITDSPLLNSLVYENLHDNITGAGFRENVIGKINEFNNVNIFLERVKEYNPNGRNQNENEAIELDSIILKRLDDMGFNYLKFDGDYNGINEITEYILKWYTKKSYFLYIDEII